MKRCIAVAICAALTIICAPKADAGMAVYQFAFKTTTGGPSGPYGSLTVTEGFNTVDTLSFKIDLDESIFGSNVDIHEFGFQLDFSGTPDLVPKPQTAGDGTDSVTLTSLGTMAAVAGFGSTKWDYMVSFGDGTPTIEPVTFTIGASGLTLSALNVADVAYKNNNPSMQSFGNFAVHAQGGNSQNLATGNPSEGLYGSYVNTVGSVVPELGNTCSAIAALITGICLSLRRVGAKH